MLLPCPECGHSVSDKALACPQCGFPISTTVTTSAAPKRRRKYKRLPNGYGSIKKLSGTRKRPYAAYPPCPGFKTNGMPISTPAIGYYETWHLAYQALQEYLKSPYDLAQGKLTFAEIYDLFYKDKFELSAKKFSDATKSAYQIAFKNCTALHNISKRQICRECWTTALSSTPVWNLSAICSIKCTNTRHKMTSWKKITLSISQSIFRMMTKKGNHSRKNSFTFYGRMPICKQFKLS